MPSFISELPTWLALIALLLVIVEVAVFGFGTLFLIYAAIGCTVTAILMYIHILPQAIHVAVLSVAIFSLLSAGLLWKCMKQLQRAKRSPGDQPNVFKGLKLRLAQDLHPGNSVVHRYSGIEWQVFLAAGEPSMAAGTEVEVIKTEVGRMIVKRAD